MKFIELVSKLPRISVSMMFAYGSGVVHQTGEIMSKNMIDFIVAVDDPLAWHKENLRRNSAHYSFMKVFGPSYISKFQTRYAAKLYCNTMVNVNGHLIKYSVISTADLISDLLHWETLYVSGRLHKPVYFMVPVQGSHMEKACEVNIQNACHAALLLLPESFSFEDFCIKVSSLSYMGDFRMIIGENKSKIHNIVKPNIDRFAEIYLPVLDQISAQVYLDRSHFSFKQDLSPVSIYHHMELLPKQVLLHLQAECNKDGRNRDLEEVSFVLSKDFEYMSVIRKALCYIVVRSSLSQTFKNIFSAGIVKTVSYSFRKMKKMFTGPNDSVNR
ncbi:unnamed protein product [Soboliphyme baturini]|uniref:Phosphatidate cytidylyltransferase, mitochondrial n=1 Tax=Soboliphyme baturini TaxID=241478 RepID=A0A183IWV8_9BILA|nr:unnamed protein product [Soboliphyme baturini]